jgi:hypothetical protein
MSARRRAESRKIVLLESNCRSDETIIGNEMQLTRILAMGGLLILCSSADTFAECQAPHYRKGRVLEGSSPGMGSSGAGRPIRARRASPCRQ